MASFIERVQLSLKDNVVNTCVKAVLKEVFFPHIYDSLFSKKSMTLSDVIILVIYNRTYFFFFR